MNYANPFYVAGTVTIVLGLMYLIYKVVSSILEERASATSEPVFVTRPDDFAFPRPLATLACGAKVVQLEPHDIACTSCAIDRHQPESVRKGGVFFQCYGRCPYLFNCTYFKEFADLHLGKDFSIPIEHGKRLELQRGNGHRHISLVDDTDVKTKTITVSGVSFAGSAERYTTVPPLFQDVEEPSKK